LINDKEIIMAKKADAKDSKKGAPAKPPTSDGKAAAKKRGRPPKER
jgi:hypothetical protein